MKVIFDATFGENWVDALTLFFRTYKEPRPRFQHIYDAFGRDVKDDEWIPKLAAELECLIVTCDAGRREPRLPDICKQCNKSYVVFSPSLHHSNKFTQARAIVELWPEIERAMNAPVGSHFQIQTTDAAHEHFKLVKKE